jgi:hypothetical protein
MTASRHLLIAALLAMAAGCASSSERNEIPAAAASILEGADKFELLSLDPHFSGGHVEEGFHNYKILGQTELSDPRQRTMIVSALKKGAEEAGSPAMCFDPRHGIRVVRGGEMVDFVICFECSRVDVYVDGSKGESFLVSKSPQPVFDRALTDAGIPLAKRPSR